MKWSLVCLMVSGLFCLGTGSALASQSRGGLAPQDLASVFVVDLALDTAKLAETVTLLDLSTVVSPPPGGGPALRGGNDGLYQLNLDLKDPSDQRVHQLILAAKNRTTPVNLSFTSSGAIARVELADEPVVFAPPPASTRGHIQVSELDNVFLADIVYDVSKNAATLNLVNTPICDDVGPVPATRAPQRCGGSSPAMSLALDLGNESDARSFALLLDSYAGAGVVNLAFSQSGELTSIALASGFVVNGSGCYVREYYMPVTMYQKIDGIWTPVVSYRLHRYLDCPQHVAK